MSNLMQDPFHARPEVIFAEYHDVIKSPIPLLLNQIGRRMQQTYEPFLWLEEFIQMDYPNLTRLAIQRTKKNILEYLAKRPFDYDKAYVDLINRYDNIYRESELLAMGRALSLVRTQKFTKAVYIYTPTYDERVHLDIQATYHDMERVAYITGDFEEIVKDLGITCYMLADIDLIPKIVDLKRAEYTHILLGTYGYNYVLNEAEVPNNESMDEETEESEPSPELEGMGESLDYRIDIESIIDKTLFKFATFQPEDLGPEHFTMLIEG